MVRDPDGAFCQNSICSTIQTFMQVHTKLILTASGTRVPSAPITLD